MTVDQRARKAAEAVRQNALDREPLRVLSVAAPPTRPGLVLAFVGALLLVVVALSAVVLVNPFGGRGGIAPAPSPQTSVPAQDPATTTAPSPTSSSTSTTAALGLTSQSGNMRLVSEALTSRTDAPLAGVSVLDDLAFVGGVSQSYEDPTRNSGVRILDLSDVENPRRVGRIALRSSGYFSDYSTGDAVVTHLDGEVFVGDVAVVLDGVPDEYAPEDYPEPYGIWDVTDPSEPELLSVLSPESAPHLEGGDIGDRPLDAKDLSGGYFFFLYDAGSGRRIGRDVRVAVADISDPSNPEVVAEWQDNREVLMSGLVLNEDGTRAYVTGLWPPPYGWDTEFIYLYILDVADPANPALIGEYTFPVRGLPSQPFKALPTEDETHVLLLDGSHDRDEDTLAAQARREHLGIVHILDITDLDSIQKVGSWGPDTVNPNWGVATDVVVRDNIAFTTWTNDVVYALDISDPTAPSVAGEFRTRHAAPWISDVALYRDKYLLASTVWGPGLYILEILDQQPASP